MPRQYYVIDYNTAVYQVSRQNHPGITPFGYCLSTERKVELHAHHILRRDLFGNPTVKLRWVQLYSPEPDEPAMDSPLLVLHSRSGERHCSAQLSPSFPSLTLLLTTHPQLTCV